MDESKDFADNGTKAEGKKIQGAFADIGKPRGDKERDSVPRILVKNFKRQTKVFSLFRLFDKFGAVTYIAMRDQQAVVEFSQKEAVNEVLQCKHLALAGARLSVYRLTWFPHTDSHGHEFQLSKDLLAACDTAHVYQDGDTPLMAWLRNLVNACMKDAMESKEAVARMVQRTQELLRKGFPHCQVYEFGSRTTGLALPGADLDLFIDIGNMYNGDHGQDGDSQRALVSEASKCLLKDNDFRGVERVLTARVPILRFFYAPPVPALDVHADAAFRNGLGVENSKLLRFLLNVDNRLRPLIILLKQWARWQGLGQQANLRGPAFTSYAIAVLAIFFLQQPPKPQLPPIAALIHAYCGPKKRISGWESGFVEDVDFVRRLCKDRAVNNTTDPIPAAVALAQDLFAFYRHFDYENLAIVPLLGRAVPRTALEEALAGNGEDVELRDAFKDYVKNVEEYVYAEQLNIRAVFLVQDPIEHCHNLTRNVKEDVLMKFISSCALTHEWLVSQR